MNNSLDQQLSQHSTVKHSHRLLNRCGLLVLGSGWVVAIALAGMGLTNWCVPGKEAGNYSSSAISTNYEGIIQKSKPQSSVPFWIYLLLIVSVSPWLFTYFRKQSVASNSKKPIRSGLRCGSTCYAGSPSSLQPITGYTSRGDDYNLPQLVQPVSSVSQEQKPVSYRISRVSSRQPSAVLGSTLSVRAKNIRLPFEQLK
ncbi:hypothetical protein IQ238_24150 [Pleurocapsales cyanobacterium LEGE 06147]|nr:hypothetical protein [Pleurocapsales cyanobacterium LEGE 06147]